MCISTEELQDCKFNVIFNFNFFSTEEEGSPEPSEPSEPPAYAPLPILKRARFYKHGNMGKQILHRLFRVTLCKEIFKMITHSLHKEGKRGKIQDCSTTFYQTDYTCMVSSQSTKKTSLLQTTSV